MVCGGQQYSILMSCIDLNTEDLLTSFIFYDEQPEDV